MGPKQVVECTHHKLCLSNSEIERNGSSKGSPEDHYRPAFKARMCRHMFQDLGIYIYMS